MEERSTGRGPNRRTLLKTLAGGAMFGLAGCNGTGGSDQTTNEPTTTTAESTPTATTTDAPTTTEAPPTTTDGGGGGPDVSGPTAGLDPCLGSLAGKETETCSEPEEINSNIETDTTLGGECKQYHVTRTVSVRNGANLTIEPGTRLSFAQGAGLSVEENSSMTAAGTCGQPIVFTGDQETRGYWRGIQFISADRTESKLEYCVVEYGGREKYTWAPAKANLAVISGARVSVAHSTVRESAGYGVVFDDEATVDTFTQNALTKNDTGAAYVYAKTAQFLAADSTYTGNDDDVVAVHGSDLDSDYEETWDAIDVPYRVLSGDDVAINGHLTLAPGTSIEFGQNAGMQVLGDGPGELTAVGVTKQEEVKPITFTGEQKTRGYWRGILFQSTDQTPSRLQHCVVEYGGGNQYTWAEDSANIAVINGSRVNVSHSTVRESDAFGVLLSDDVIVNSFVNNTITRNDVAGRVYASTAHYLSDTSTFKGNDHDYVYLEGNDFGKDLEETWDAIDVPYQVESGSHVNVYGHLTVDPGATVEFDQDAGLKVLSDGPGRFTAVGIVPDTEEVRPITFTGVQKTRGYWRGILFAGTDRTENQLRYCVVEYGGGKQYTWPSVSANVVVDDGSRVRIDNCTIRESGAYGFDFDSDTKIDSFTQNTVTRNDDGAGWVRAPQTHFLSDTSTFAGNDDDAVFVRGETIGTDVEGTWDAIDVPYRVTNGRIVDVNGHITIDAGATVEFEQNAGMRALGDGPGAITAVGTSDDPIRFTGDQKTPGYWRGLAFANTARTENKLVHCVVEYGGGDNYTWSPKKGDVMLYSGARLTLTDSTIRNGAGYGVVVDDESTITSSGNTVAGNALGSVYTG